MRIAASSRPAFRLGKSATSPSTSPGRKPSTGMLWRMSRSGSRNRSAVWEDAAAHPNTSANPYEMISAKTPRDSEYSVYFGSADGDRSMWMACTYGAPNSRANATTPPIVAPMKHRTTRSATETGRRRRASRESVASNIVMKITCGPRSPAIYWRRSAMPFFIPLGGVRNYAQAADDSCIGRPLGSGRNDTLGPGRTLRTATRLRDQQPESGHRWSARPGARQVVGGAAHRSGLVRLLLRLERLSLLGDQRQPVL